MDAQRLRNLTTTRRLHTEISHVYLDIEFLTDTKGIMTHHLPNAARALEPWLREKVTDSRFWNGEYDKSHTGEIALEPMDEEALLAFWKRYEALPSLLLREEVK